MSPPATTPTLQEARWRRRLATKDVKVALQGMVHEPYAEDWLETPFR